MNKQEIMSKYTKLVAKRLYNQDNFNVKFVEHFTSIDSGEGLRAKNSVESENAIYYNGTLYEKGELAPHAWITIVHEITHFKVDMKMLHIKGKVYLCHSDKFKEIEKQNLKKVDDLRKQFNKEVGWNGDEEYDLEEDYIEEKENLVLDIKNELNLDIDIEHELKKSS